MTGCGERHALSPDLLVFLQGQLDQLPALRALALTEERNAGNKVHPPSAASDPIVRLARLIFPTHYLGCSALRLGHLVVILLLAVPAIYLTTAED